MKHFQEESLSSLQTNEPLGTLGESGGWSKNISSFQKKIFWKEDRNEEDHLRSNFQLPLDQTFSHPLWRIETSSPQAIRQQALIVYPKFPRETVPSFCCAFSQTCLPLHSKGHLFSQEGYHCSLIPLECTQSRNTSGNKAQECGQSWQDWRSLSCGPVLCFSIARFPWNTSQYIPSPAVQKIL